MVDEKITIGELGGYTNNISNKEGIKKVVKAINDGLNPDLSDYQKKLTAGSNITITDENVISATIPPVESLHYLTKTEFAELGINEFIDSTTHNFKRNCIFSFKYFGQTGREIYYHIIGIKDKGVNDSICIKNNGQVSAIGSGIYRSIFSNIKINFSYYYYAESNQKLSVYCNVDDIEIYNADNDKIKFYFENEAGDVAHNSVSFDYVDSFTQTTTKEYKVGVY